MDHSCPFLVLGILTPPAEGRSASGPRLAILFPMAS